MDEAGFADAHIVGNSLGGFLALKLAARGRARTVVAFAPAGGWAPGDEAFDATLVPHFTTMREQLRSAVPHAEALLATPQGKRMATQFTTVNYQHIPIALLAHQMRGVVACEAASALLASAQREGGHCRPSASSAPYGSSGAPRTGCCPGRRLRLAFAMTGRRTPTGSSSAESGIARSSTYHARPCS
ncbi:MAG TPA: hypothetical protein VHW67_11890 [Solirubrobacteraceae bacterium]|jgi:pimeloyl-ACP methyl ester carboxylesterase|nr:hypothetical protein [Solirubrobacteraceae bacterium]